MPDVTRIRFTKLDNEGKRESLKTFTSLTNTQLKVVLLEYNKKFKIVDDGGAVIAEWSSKNFNVLLRMLKKQLLMLVKDKDMFIKEKRQRNNGLDKFEELV